VRRVRALGVTGLVLLGVTTGGTRWWVADRMREEAAIRQAEDEADAQTARAAAGARPPDPVDRPDVDVWRVSGTGDTQADGVYRVAGQHDGMKLFLAASGYVLYYARDGAPPGWRIAAREGDEPVCTGWYILPGRFYGKPGTHPRIDPVR
jgi:hypothetical protein